MKDICLKFAAKVNSNLNSFLFLYGGNQLNFELKFKEQANSFDKINKEMKILVYKEGDDTIICPHCGKKIKLKTEKIDEIISKNKNIKDNVDGIKLQIENIIKNSTINQINTQLKNVNIILNTINQDINKNIEQLKSLLNYDIIDTIDNNIVNKNNSINIINSNNLEIKNSIKGILDIKLNEIKKDKIILFTSNINNGIDVYLNNNKINMINDFFKWKIDYNFEKDGKYNFEIAFNDPLKKMAGFFEGCSNIISLDFSNFDSSNVTNMRNLFSKCSKLKEITGLNKFVTNKVNNMYMMFQECSELKTLDLSNFDTKNVTDMGFMFNKCKNLKEIKGINKFVTKEVKSMERMFSECSELKTLDLSSFTTYNTTKISYMFDKCKKLKEFKGNDNLVEKYNSSK